MAYVVIFLNRMAKGSPPVFAIWQSIILLFDCHTTYQLVDERISETAIMKKILETSYRKILNPVYQYYDYQLINQVHQIKFDVLGLTHRSFNV